MVDCRADVAPLLDACVIELDNKAAASDVDAPGERLSRRSVRRHRISAWREVGQDETRHVGGDSVLPSIPRSAEVQRIIGRNAVDECGFVQQQVGTECQVNDVTGRSTVTRVRESGTTRREAQTRIWNRVRQRAAVHSERPHLQAIAGHELAQ
jgi:hypothetical protein